MQPYTHEKSYTASCKCYYCKVGRSLRRARRKRFKTDPIRRGLKKAARRKAKREIQDWLLE